MTDQLLPSTIPTIPFVKYGHEQMFKKKEVIELRKADWTPRCAEDDAKTMTRVMQRLIIRKLVQAWSTWSNVHTGIAAAREVLGRSVKYIVHRQLACGWTSWREMYSDAIAVDRRLLREARGFVISRRKACALASWRADASHCAALAAGEEKLKVASTFYIRRGLGKGWQC